MSIIEIMDIDPDNSLIPVETVMRDQSPKSIKMNCLVL